MGQVKGVLVVALLWTAVTGAFLVVMGYGVVNQCRTWWFAEAVGTVDAIRETSSHSTKGGSTYGVDVHYHYSVAGQRYDSDRLRYLQMSSTSTWARHMLKMFPAGSHPSVYYNGWAPEQATLLRGPEGMDLFFMLFMTPFVLVGVALWAFAARGWRKARGFDDLRIVERGEVTRIAQSRWLAVWMGGVGLAISAALGVFAVIVEPVVVDGEISLKWAGCVWIVVLAVGVLVGVRRWVRIRAGREDLVLDDGRGTLTTPKGGEIAYRNITGLRVATIIQGNDKGGSARTYEVWLDYKRPDGGPEKLKLEDWVEEEAEARRFAAWLGLRVGVGE